jgi:hypothetical protein
MEVSSMLTREQPIVREETTTRAADRRDDIESELLFSVREVGIACFPIPELEFEDD